MEKKQSKAQKTAAVVEAARHFCRVANADDTTDTTYDEAISVLQRSVEVLEEHAAPPKDNPGADYYTVTVAGKEQRRARCKFCGKELNPRGVTRHVLSPGCRAAYAELAGLDADDTEALESELRDLAESFGMEFPSKSSAGGEED